MKFLLRIKDAVYNVYAASPLLWWGILWIIFVFGGLYLMTHGNLTGGRHHRH